MRLSSISPLSVPSLKPAFSRAAQPAQPVSSEPRFADIDPFEHMPFHEKLLLNTLSVSSKLLNKVSFGRLAQDAKDEPWLAVPFFKKKK